MELEDARAVDQADLTAREAARVEPDGQVVRALERQAEERPALRPAVAQTALRSAVAHSVELEDARAVDQADLTVRPAARVEPDEQVVRALERQAEERRALQPAVAQPACQPAVAQAACQPAVAHSVEPEDARAVEQADLTVRPVARAEPVAQAACQPAVAHSVEPKDAPAVEQADLTVRPAARVEPDEQVVRALERQAEERRALRPAVA